MTVATLPKAGSGAFKEIAARIASVLDMPRLIIVIDGALDRKQLEEVLRKMMRPTPIRASSLDRSALIGTAAKCAHQDVMQAYVLYKMMDKTCQKERSIVDSIDPEHIGERIRSYRALEFRRERSRLIWALVRDGRPMHIEAAEAVLTETFTQMRARPGEHDPEDVKDLNSQLEVYEGATRRLGERVRREVDARTSIEEERGELIGKIGLRERQLREERERRATAEAEGRRLRNELHEMQERFEHIDTSAIDEVAAERDRLRDKARALENRLEHAEKLRMLDEENAALREELSALRASSEAAEARNQEKIKELTEREAAAHERVQSLRASLKTARQLAAMPKDASVAEGEPLAERVGVFIDAENLIASARAEHGGKFDFERLLPELIGERRKVMAVAFVVDKDKEVRGRESLTSDFAGFVRALQAAGYEVRSKRPRHRADGTSKADWDMGIAMEIIDARNKLDVVVLCSGDGDFLPLVQRLKRWRRRVEVASFAATTHKELMRAADEFQDLSGRFRRGTAN